jgi:hypothetical protein
VPSSRTTITCVCRGTFIAAASVAEVHYSIAILQPLASELAQQRENVAVVCDAIELVLQGQRIAAGV